MIETIKEVLIMMWSVLKIALPIFIIIEIIILVRPYFIKHETVQLYTGGLGTGKSLLSVRKAIRLYKLNTRKVKIYNIFHRKKKRTLPRLYSNIPIKYKGKIISRHPSPSILTGETRMVEKSILFIDELSIFCNQWENQRNNSKIKDLEDFITLFRHYTKGGYLIINTQNINKVNHNIRYCIDKCIDCYHFYKILFLGVVKIREIDLSCDVVNVNESFKEDNTKRVFIILTRKTRYYDTFAYSDLYNPIKDDDSTIDNTMKVQKKFKLE